MKKTTYSYLWGEVVYNRELTFEELYEYMLLPKELKTGLNFEQLLKLFKDLNSLWKEYHALILQLNYGFNCDNAINMIRFFNKIETATQTVKSRVTA